jgi:hypothetical protein
VGVKNFAALSRGLGVKNVAERHTTRSGTSSAPLPAVVTMTHRRNSEG